MVTAMARILDAPPVHRRTNGRVPPPPPPGGDGGDGFEEPRRGPRLDNVRLAMIMLMSGEAMFFGGLVSAYFVLRSVAVAWPPPLQPRLPVAVTALNTVVLLASSVTMRRAMRALAAGDRFGLVRRLTATAGLGALFVVVQGLEWMRLVHFGLTVSSGSFGSTFYTIIGTHAAHVVGALAWLTAVLLLALAGRVRPGRDAAARACAMYWHFVVGLWPILYVTVYLL